MRKIKVNNKTLRAQCPGIHFRKSIFRHYGLISFFRFPVFALGFVDLELICSAVDVFSCELSYLLRICAVRQKDIIENEWFISLDVEIDGPKSRIRMCAANI